MGNSFYTPTLPDAVANEDWFTKLNLEATSNPGSADDSTQGYKVGSVWINSDKHGVFRCVSATAGNAKWVRIPTLAYVFEGYANFTSSQSDGTYFINLDTSTFAGANGNLNVATGFRSQAAVTLRSGFTWLGWKPGAVSQSPAVDYDPFGLRLDGGGSTTPGYLYPVRELGEGYYRVRAIVNHPPNEANLKYTTSTAIQEGQGNFIVGIDFTGVTPTNIDINKTIEWGFLDNFSGEPETGVFSRVIYVKTDPMRFWLRANFDNAGEVYGVWISVEKIS